MPATVSNRKAAPKPSQVSQGAPAVRGPLQEGTQYPSRAPTDGSAPVATGRMTPGDSAPCDADGLSRQGGQS